MASKDFECWACMEVSGQISPWAYKPRDADPTDVDIRILSCGICGSDVHQMDSGWGKARYPMVPGHEVIGIVTAVGSEVKEFKVGQRVGVGPQRWSCGTCEDCKNHDEVMCSKMVWLYNSKLPDGSIGYGGYAKSIRVDHRFVFAIPDNLPTDAAAPLLCAGVTVFSPLYRFGYGKGHKIGVLGIGGLGHMAIKFGKALGCEVTAISSTPDKQKDCKDLGADNFLCSKNKEDMAAKERYFDAIVCSSSASLKFSTYIKLLKSNSRFILVGLPEEKLTFEPWDFTSKQTSVVGSSVASPPIMKEMFRVASEHNILSDVQVWPIEKVNEAIAAFREGKPKFRFVLKIADQ